MREMELPRPRATVATIVVRDDAFLVVEESTATGLRINQPAGHLESGETLAAGAARETLEETGYHVAPTALVGIYRWRSPDERRDVHPLRVRRATSSRHDPMRTLDEGIVRAFWLPYAELAAAATGIAARSSCAASTTIAPACGGRSTS